MAQRMSERSPPTDLARVRFPDQRHMWVEFNLLLVLVLAPRVFSPGTPVFPSPQEPTLLNSNSIWKVSPISALRLFSFHHAGAPN